jgi:hypothetical protein
MTCDKCKTGELQVIRVRRYSSPLVVVGYVLWIVALAAALAVGVSQYRSTQSAGPATDVAKQNAIAKLRQIDAVTPAMISDFEDDGQISETSLSTLNPDDRADVEKILSDYRTGALDTAGGGTGGPGGVVYVTIYVLCGAVFIIGVALTLKKELLQCAACGAVSEV